MKNNKFVAAIRENKNNIRQKLLLGVGVAGAAIAAVAVVYVKNQQPSGDVLVIAESPVEPVDLTVAS